ncbi:hypothetical protein CLOM_g19425 [Closterium sp. NIES-68]|nr:hypothetical protein CLOM_g19425 [Closterium sp. NIES-68]
MKPVRGSEPLDSVELAELSLPGDGVASTRTEEIDLEFLPGEIDWEAIIPVYRKESIDSRGDPKHNPLYDVNGRLSDALTNYPDTSLDENALSESGEGEREEDGVKKSPPFYSEELVGESRDNSGEMSGEISGENDEEDLSELVEWRVPKERGGRLRRMGMPSRGTMDQASGIQADTDEDYKEDGDHGDNAADDGMGETMRPRTAVRSQKFEDWDYDDVSRSEDEVGTGKDDVNLAGIGTSDNEDDSREDAAASLQGYQYERMAEQKQDFLKRPMSSSSMAHAGEEDEPREDASKAVILLEPIFEAPKDNEDDSREDAAGASFG